MRSNKVNLIYLLAVAVFGVKGVCAADLDVCVALPITMVNQLIHQNLAGVRADVSEEAHSFGCAYGAGGLVSVSVIRPGGSAAFSRTSSRYPNATTVAGLGDKPSMTRALVLSPYSATRSLTHSYRMGR
jgi:hypothetical protein